MCILVFILLASLKIMLQQSCLIWFGKGFFAIFIVYRISNRTDMGLAFKFILFSDEKENLEK